MGYHKKSFKKAKSYGRFKRTARKVNPVNNVPRGGFRL